jgi:hypothetical protein
MIRFVFWNINDNRTPELNIALTQLSTECDFLVLAENDNISDSEIETLTGFKILHQHGMRSNNRWIYIYSKEENLKKLNFISKSETSSEDELPVSVSSSEEFQKYLNRFERLLLFELIINKKEKGVEKLLIGITHMVSKYSADQMKQRLFANKIRQAIEQVLTAFPNEFNKRCILFGDFNLNPFEEIMADPLCFRSYKSISDTINTPSMYGENPFAFYNPCHFLKGEELLDGISYKIPGTYYYDKTIGEKWNTFDQIIFTPEAQDSILESSIELITNIGGVSLINEKILPNETLFSDHLPIKFTLNI